jgi:HK97 family phage portal protein
MQIGPLSLEWRRKSPSVLSSIDQRGGWFPIIRESIDGAWQNNVTVETASVLTYVTVYACITLIASDIGKLRIKLVQQASDGTWDETTSPAFSPVLKNPNDYQNRLQFLENWVASKLISGNTYVLKQRDERRIVTQLYILDPNRVKVLLSSDGAVYYQLATDTISGLPETVTVPANEIIHDRMCPLHHPLVGVSPITACGLAAIQGLRIQENSTLFFQNGAAPGGILSSDQVIKNDQATELKNRWEANYGGANRGAVAVLGNGLKYQQLMMSAVDSQLIEQLRWTSETVCSAFHVPPFKVGVGTYPSYNNVEALDQQYYSQCLQTLIEHIEALLDKGLGLETAKDGRTLGTELDLDGLLRMDSSTRMDTASKAMTAGLTPDEVRKKYHDLGPVNGGEKVFLQRQNWPLELLGSDVPPPPAPVVSAPEDDTYDETNEPEPDDAERSADAMILRALVEGHRLERAAAHV